MRSTAAVGALVAALALVSSAGARPGSAKKSPPASGSADAKSAGTKSASKKSKPAKSESKKSKPAKPESKKPEQAEPESEPAAAEPESEPAAAEPEMYSPGMVGAGVALTLLGTGGIVAGTTWIFVRRDAHSLFSASPLYAGLTIGGGSALLLAGLPLWIIGAGDAEDEPAKKDEPAEEKATIRITPILGPTSAGLHVQF